MSEANNVSLIFIELGLAVIGLALLARLASRWGFSAIPLYLLGGLSFGKADSCRLTLAKISFMWARRLVCFYCSSCLGLEYTGADLKTRFSADCPQAWLIFC